MVESTHQIRHFQKSPIHYARHELLTSKTENSAFLELHIASRMPVRVGVARTAI